MAAPAAVTTEGNDVFGFNGTNVSGTATVEGLH
jgi:hypothetical protein